MPGLIWSYTGVEAACSAKGVVNSSGLVGHDKKKSLYFVTQTQSQQVTNDSTGHGTSPSSKSQKTRERSAPTELVSSAPRGPL